MKKAAILILAILLAVAALAGCGEAVGGSVSIIEAPNSADIFTGEVKDMLINIRGVGLNENGKKFLGRDVYFGPITTPQQAAEIAESVWIRMYGEEIREKRPYQVGYSDILDTWIVYSGEFMQEGSLKCYLKGETGKLRAVYYYVDEQYDKSNWIEYTIEVDETGMMYDDIGEFNAVLFSEYYSGPLFTVNANGDIESANSEKIYHGRADSPLDVIRIAEEELTDSYGVAYMARQRPYLVKFDPDTKIWMIMGSMKDEEPDPLVLGGGDGLTVLVYQETGEILSSWQGE